MTKEQIKKAVDEYIGYSPEMDEGIETTMRRNAFKDGANWRINSVWHKPEEVPEANRAILIRFNEITRLWMRSEFLDWEVFVEDKNVSQWAYLNDLIPTEDERNS